MILLHRLAAKGFYDPESGFGEGCAYNVGLGQQLCIPTGRKLTAAGNVVTAVPLRGRNECRGALGENATTFLGMAAGLGGGLPRDNRPWLRHQHEVTIDVSGVTLIGDNQYVIQPDVLEIPIEAIIKPISVCAPGGVSFQLNKTASDDTYIMEMAIVRAAGNPASAANELLALHPPSLTQRLRGVSQWLAPARARTVKIAQRSIRRAFFSKVARLKDDTRAMVLKLEIPEFGQEKAASLDVWPVMDISNMDLAELSYAFEDGVDSIHDTIGFSGGIHPKETCFFKLDHHSRNEISYSPVHDLLKCTVTIRWYDNKGEWRAGAPDMPEDASLQYSLVHDKWVTEEELNAETLGDRKRKYGFVLDTLYK